MGLAIAAGVLAVGGAAYGAYSSNKAANATKKNAAGLQAGYADAMQYVPQVKPVKFDRLNLPEATSAFSGYLDQKDQLDDLGKFRGEVAGRDNDAWRAILERAMPGLSNSIRRDAKGLKASQQDLLHYGRPLVVSRLKGELSAETQANVARSAAQQSLQGGFGANSGSGRALGARDLGRTTEDLQTLGFNELGQFGGMVAQNQQGTAQMANLARLFSPDSGSVSPLLFSPQQILQRGDQTEVFNTQTANSEKAYNTSIDFENQNAKFQALLNAAGINYQGNQAVTNATAQRDQAIGSTISAAGSALGGVGGGFGGGGGAGAAAAGAGNSLPATNTAGFYGSRAGASQAYGSGASLSYWPGSGGGWYNTGY